MANGDLFRIFDPDTVTPEGQPQFNLFDSPALALGAGILQGAGQQQTPVGLGPSIASGFNMASQFNQGRRESALRGLAMARDAQHQQRLQSIADQRLTLAQAGEIRGMDVAERAAETHALNQQRTQQGIDIAAAREGDRRDELAVRNEAIANLPEDLRRQVRAGVKTGDVGERTSPTQRARNRKIREARRAIRRAISGRPEGQTGLQHINMLTSSTLNTGRPNKLYDPTLARQMSVAANPLVNEADDDFDAFNTDLRSAKTLATTPAAGEVSAGTRVNPLPADPSGFKINELYPGPDGKTYRYTGEGDRPFVEVR